MTHTFRWRKTQYGPLNPSLEGRFGELCQVITTGRNGSRWIRFEDGYEAVVPQYAVRRVAS